MEQILRCLESTIFKIFIFNVSSLEKFRENASVVTKVKISVQTKFRTLSRNEITIDRLVTFNEDYFCLMYKK